MGLSPSNSVHTCAVVGNVQSSRPAELFACLSASVGFQRQCHLLICSCSCDRASITMITDSPHKANVDGEIQLNQRTLDAIIRASQPSSRSPLVGSVCQQRHNSDHRSFGWTGHIASGVQLAPSHSTGCWLPVAQPARTLPELYM